MDKANGENKSPSRRVHFLLQKNTGKNERQLMTSKEAMSLALFLMPLTTAEGDDPKPTLNKRKDNTKMDYENFKEQFVADVKDRLILYGEAVRKKAGFQSLRS